MHRQRAARHSSGAMKDDRVYMTFTRGEFVDAPALDGLLCSVLIEPLRGAVDLI